MSETIDFFTAAFAKTDTGQQEIQHRALGLAPMVRRILVLVDGQRCGKDLAAFAAGSDIGAILGCIEARPRDNKPGQPSPGVEAAAVAPTSESAGTSTFLARLPPAAERTTAQNEMARNFMVNTVNNIFGQQTRISLVESVARAQGTDGLRLAYLGWEEAMAGSRAGAKRLPEFQDKLVNVL